MFYVSFDSQEAEQAKLLSMSELEVCYQWDFSFYYHYSFTTYFFSAYIEGEEKANKNRAETQTC